MMKAIVLASATLLAAAAPSLAQSTTQTTTTTTTQTVPDNVRTYVTGQSASSVTVEEEVAVGSTLPDTVTIAPIPDNDEYGYAIVNDRRVVINPRTRSVIEVYD